MKKISMFNIINYSIISVFSIFCIVPILLVAMISVTKEEIIKRYGYSFIPREISFEAYEKIFSGNPRTSNYIGNSLVLNSYIISIIITVAGTITAVLITAMAAYTLSNKHVKCRGSLSLFFFVTMVFSGGIVPWYLICVKLGLRDNLFALLIPSLLFNPFDLFLARNYMNGIPDSLMESARIDGANDIFIAFKIYFPLSVPVLAAISLFYGIRYWNDWWNAIMLVERDKLYPLQYMLYKIQSEIKALEILQQMGVSGANVVPPAESLKMATVIVTIGPIVFLYPFLQKYFIKGLIIGSVKG